MDDGGRKLGGPFEDDCLSDETELALAAREVNELLRQGWDFRDVVRGYRVPRAGILPEDQMAIQRRLLDTLQYGVEEVDVRKLFEGMEHRDVYSFGMALKDVQLSDFCRGNCGFCARDAAPYGRMNRRVLEIESLKEFLDRHPPMMGEIYLYDASDPLDYPWILELVTFLEAHPNYNKIKILTSCPPGSEEMFKALMRKMGRGGSGKFVMQLSLSSDNEARLKANGILDWVDEQDDQDPLNFCRIKTVHVEQMGRARRPGELAAGFELMDKMALMPDGPMVSEHHLASDLYPVERKLIHLSTARRVYPKPVLSAVRKADMFGNTKVYTPESHFYDLDDNHEMKSETALRHLVTYLYFFLRNLAEGAAYSSKLADSWLTIKEALDSGEFVIPDDAREVDFYKKVLLGFMGQIGELFPESSDRLAVPGILSSWAFGSGENLYPQLAKQIQKDLGRHAEMFA